MAKFFKNSSGDAPGGGDTAKKRQQLLLLLLLVVGAGVGYAYFFTGLIRPNPAANPPPVQNAQIKQPIPPRPDAGTAKGGPEAAGTKGSIPPAGSPSPAAVTPAATPAKQEAPKPAGAVAKNETAKPAPQAKGEPVKAAPAAKAEPAKTPPATAKADAGKTAKPASGTEASKQGAAVKQEIAKAGAVPAPSKGKEETKAAAKQAGAKAVTAARKPRKAAEKPMPGAYDVAIGEFINDENLSSLKIKLTQLGATPLVLKNVKRVEPMNRLLIKSFDTRPAADAEMQKIRKTVPDAFVLNEQGKFALYAGSYYSEKRALAEKGELGERGIPVSVRKTKTTIQMVHLSAGSFATSSAADKEAKRLKKLGISAKVEKKS